MGKAIRQGSRKTWLGKSSELRMLKEKGLFLSVSVDDIKLAGKKQNNSPTWKILRKTLIWANQHHSLTTFIWVALKENFKQAKTLWTVTGACSNPESLLELQKITLFRETWREHFLLVP